MNSVLAEDKLIEYAKIHLKAKGFKKKNKRWTKDVGEFTLSFLVQSSCYSKENYYVRVGVFINALMPTELYYGHWMTDIESSTAEEILSKFEDWCEQWTNKHLIKERLLAFIEWEKRNPLEKRRAEIVDYTTDPIPAKEFFAVNSQTKQFIIDNF